VKVFSNIIQNLKSSIGISLPSSIRCESKALGVKVNQVKK